MTRRLSFIAVLPLLLLSFALQEVASANTYHIDPAHTAIGFSVRHMAISTVKGGFDEFDGSIQLDPSDFTKSSVQFTIKTESINTKNADRDKHLRSADFFDAAKYPKIVFESKKITKDGDVYKVEGPLQMHGKTQTIEIPIKVSGPVTDPWGNQRIGAEGKVTIDRRDWGINWSKTLDKGGLMVGNDVEIELAVEAVHKKEANPADVKTGNQKK